MASVLSSEFFFFRTHSLRAEFGAGGEWRGVRREASGGGVTL